MEKREFKDNKKSYGNRGSRPSRKFSGSGSARRAPRRKSDDDNEERPRRRFDDNEEGRPRRKFNRENNGENKERRFGKRKFDNDRRDERPKRRFDRERTAEERPRRKFEGALSDEERLERKLERRKNFGRKDEEKRPRRRDVTAESEILTEIVERRKAEGRQAKQKQKVLSLEQEEEHGPIRLNKYISNAGICSRRDADTLITAGAIMVNGEVVTELGTKVMPTDEVRYGDQVLQREKPVYILLNKPKDYITTTFDERDRKNVMELIKGACKEHVYPVGRLDKNTTGILLFTNNGEMAKKLMHPRSNIKKIYHVELDKNLKQSDFNAIVEGLELDDGPIVPDELSYVGDSKNEVGIAIHSGRNRIVRRIFESLDYKVVKLDRVFFAGLTKKDLPRGSWRFLTQAEINILNMLPAIN